MTNQVPRRRRRNLTTRPAPGGPRTSVVPLSEPKSEAELVRFISNPRNGFCADPQGAGGSILSLDFSSQEVLVATVLSKDPAMTDACLLPKKKTLPDGTEYADPNADFHTLTASTCTHSDLTKGKPESEWDKIVRTVQPGERRKPRDTGKTLNFAMLYLSTPQSISERNHVKLEVAETWVKNHRETYGGYYDWAEAYGALAAARGFCIVPLTSRWRWVSEERSGGREGDSAVRAAVNCAIQSISATQTKESMLRIQAFIDKNHLADQIQIIGQVHDEIIVYCQNVTTKIAWDAMKVNEDGYYTSLAFEASPEAHALAETFKSIMEGVQTEQFEALGSQIKGACSYDIAPLWAH